MVSIDGPPHEQPTLRPTPSGRGGRGAPIRSFASSRGKAAEAHLPSGRHADGLLATGSGSERLPLIGHYQVILELGRGGMGLVYLARDLKPANVLVGADGQAHVADFGLAFMFGDGRSRLMGRGETMGTPQYMALNSGAIPRQGAGRAGADKRGPRGSKATWRSSA